MSADLNSDSIYFFFFPHSASKTSAPAITTSYELQHIPFEICQAQPQAHIPVVSHAGGLLRKVGGCHQF